MHPRKVCLPVHLPLFLCLYLLLDTDGAGVLLPLPLHPLPLTDTDPHTGPMVPLLALVTADHEPEVGTHLNVTVCGGCHTLYPGMLCIIKALKMGPSL